MRTTLLTLGVCALLLAAGPGLAQQEQVLSRGGVSYLSGGVGVASQERLKALEKEFNLKLVFTLVEGNYVANVSVAVKDAAGKNVFEHFADGPFFMMRLPAGAYSVTATYDGKSETREVKVGQRLRTEYFRWPSKPGVDFPLPPESRRAP